MLDRHNLHKYQHHNVEFIKAKKRCAVFNEMGLGKTVATLTALSDMLDEFDTGKILIIAPLRVANHVWEQEVRNWKHLRHLRTSLCTGDKRKRLAGLNKEADVYVINKENVAWLQNHFENTKQGWPFKTVVIDESSCIKNFDTQISRALKRILNKTYNMILLSGTPSPNSLMDLWNQIFMIDFGKSLGKTLSQYRALHFQSDFMGYKYTPRPGAFAHIHNAIQPFVVSMKVEDYLDLPDVIKIKQDVTLKPEALKFYKEFEKELFCEIEGEEVTAMNAAVLAGKLLQIASGTLYVDKMGNYKEIHHEKLDALETIVDDNPDENILVAYNYKSDKERLKKRFKGAVVLADDKSAISEWNKGKIKMLLIHPQSAGHGLNLQYGGSMVVWFGMIWSLEYYLQLNARLHRQGQLRPVRIVHLIAEGTIDEEVVRVLADKNATQSSLLEALKARI